MNAVRHAVCGVDPQSWIPQGFHPFPGSPPAEATRCVVLLKHRGGEWVGPRLAYYVDGEFQNFDPDVAARGGWCIYAWRPAHASDISRVPRLTATESSNDSGRAQ